MGLSLAVTSFGVAGAATEVTLKNPGQLTAVGPINTDHGFPSWYQDSTGTRTELCLDSANRLCGLLPEDVPDLSQPISFPDNFPGEAFYQLAGAELELPGGGRAVLVLALEAAFANEVAQPGDQVVFGRQRVTVRDAPPNTTLTFTHPYGQMTVDTDADGRGKLVEDISPAIGNFQTPLGSNIGPFLKWDPAVAPAAPAGYLGDPDVEHAVVGSPFGTNFFAVSGGGLNLSTDQFSVMGKISTNHGVNADKAVLNGEHLDVFATSEGTQIQVDGQAGTFETTPMVTDRGSNRFYARIPYTGAAPTSVRVTNVGDDPTTSSTVQVTKPVGITVLEANYDGADLYVAARSATGQPLTLAGYGALTAKEGAVNIFEGTFPSAAPPASVTVTTADGEISVPVIVTGGPATPKELPPADPAPADPAPVDPAPVDPAPVGPAPVDPAPVDPAPVDPAPAAAFVDVPAGHVFQTEIAWMAQNGISYGWGTGTGQKEYRPGAATTREAMAAFLYRMAGSPAFTPPTVSPFVDVPTTHGFYKEIA
ncbi:hypothetical protein [Kocuria aegyptia]|uniref:SLH domain-containing protein n=1 Tax=Kocuria aegyptia TaxID=330943 RepID=A0ABN2KMI1_9MICC